MFLSRGSDNAALLQVAQCDSWTSDGMSAGVVRASLGQDCGCTVIQSERFDALRPFPVVVLAHDRAVSDPVDDADGLRDVRAAGRAPRGERDARDNAVAEFDHRLRRVCVICRLPQLARQCPMNSSHPSWPW